MSVYQERAIKAASTLPTQVIMKCLKVDRQGRYWMLSDGRLLSVCHEEARYKHFSDNGEGYLKTEIAGRKYYQHRLLALSFNADETKDKLKNGKYSNCVVHHLDRDKSNNTLSNLTILTKEKHQAIHNLWNKLDKMEVISWEQMENIE